MIEYTNHIELIDQGLYYLLNNEFQPIPVVFSEDFNETDFQGNNQYIRLWNSDSSWISNNSDGETREYEYNVSYYIYDSSKSDRVKIHLNWINFGERLDHVFNVNKYMTLSVIYRWHNLVTEGSNYPIDVLNEDGEKISGLKSIDKTVNITRTNWRDASTIDYQPGRYDIGRFG